jgi:hypothetical protein
MSEVNEQTFLKLKDSVRRPEFDVKKINRSFKPFERLVDEYISWNKSGNTRDEGTEREEYENEIMFCIEESKHNPDGFYLAKQLEIEFCIEADSELVSILDSIYYVLYEARKELYKNWVKENFLVIPESVLHKKVKFPKYNSPYRDLIDGYITSIKPETYEVTIQESKENYLNKGGIVVFFENVKFVD